MLNETEQIKTFSTLDAEVAPLDHPVEKLWGGLHSAQFFEEIPAYTMKYVQATQISGFQNPQPRVPKTVTIFH